MSADILHFTVMQDVSTPIREYILIDKHMRICMRKSGQCVQPLVIGYNASSCYPVLWQCLQQPLFCFGRCSSLDTHADIRQSSNDDSAKRPCVTQPHEVVGRGPSTV